MPRLFLRLFVLLSLISGAAALPASRAVAQDTIDNTFSTTFFGKVQISEIVHEWPDVSRLNKAEMDELLQAKQVLSNFFQNLKAIAQGNPMRYLAPTLAGRYPDKTALMRERFGAETYLNFEIIDFRLSKDRNEIKLRYFLSDHDRGSAATRQRAVTFDKIGGAWLISEFDNFDFD